MTVIAFYDAEYFLDQLTAQVVVQTIQEIWDVPVFATRSPDGSWTFKLHEDNNITEEYMDVMSEQIWAIIRSYQIRQQIELGKKILEEGP